MEHFNKNILPGEYLYAMKKFLINCDTPTTIALQGEWGSGKTTFWKLLKNTSIRKLYENYIEELPDELSEIGEQNDEKLYFLETPINTWELSQFNLDEQLSLAVLNQIARCINKNSEFNKLLSEIPVLKNIQKLRDIPTLKEKFPLFKRLPKVGKIIKTSFNTISSIKTDNDHIIDDLFSTEFFEKLSDLKDLFSYSVEDKLKELGKERIVIFIDDLDRIEPKKAVEVLECLNLFLSTKKCIFILAVDKDVVIEGAKDRFKAKGEAFFDKIVQLPFPLPTEYYDMETYLNDNLAIIQNMLKGNGADSINAQNGKDEMPCLKNNEKKQRPTIIGSNIFEFNNKEIKNKYLKILSASIGTNPRAIKRIFNLFYIMCEVDRFRFITNNEDEKEGNKYETKMLDLYFWYACVISSKYSNLWQSILDDVASNKESFENKDGMEQYTTGFIKRLESKSIIGNDKNIEILFSSFKSILLDLANCNSLKPDNIYGFIVNKSHTKGKLNI